MEDEIRDEWEDCINSGVVYCFCEQRGLYRNAQELMDSGIVYLDRDDLIENVLYQEDDYETITHGYGIEREEDDDGDEWLISYIDY